MRKHSETLRRVGQTATRGRKEILRILEEAPIPLSPRDIHDRFPEPKPDAATVYRNLSLLLSLGLVRSVALHERSRRYEAASAGVHRHRVVCRDCGRIEAFQAATCDLSKIEEEIRRRLGFKVADHSLEFFGSCPDCQAKEQTE
ncbi:MAG: transcriptional repressor [Syntrophorhabdaceae bacterium]|nr:transcriptional repressor [Syntrophorhabdaceae bacterium]